ncbi:MAG: ASKHA domain-containing protein [Thermoguttaceae bacterium]
MTHFNVRIEPDDTIFCVAAGVLLIDALASHDIHIRKECGGNGTCGKCLVFVNGKKRLACNVVINENMSVIIPDSSVQELESSLQIQDKSFQKEHVVFSSRSNREDRFGIALDIGTTTLVAELCHLHDISETRRKKIVAARANPQRRFGVDLISRIQVAIESSDSLFEMRQVLIDTINEMLQELSQKAAIPLSDVTILSAAGNSVMQLIFCGIDPSPLGCAPFLPPVSVFPIQKGSDLGLDFSSAGIVELMPLLGGFVGGDILAGLLATQLCESNQTAFLIDIGTNGELALWHENKLYTAATAAGPAFEGGRIQFGTVATAGAIDRVRFHDDGSVVVTTIGSSHEITSENNNSDSTPNRKILPTGICGSGLIEAIDQLWKHKLIKAMGQFDIKLDSPFFHRFCLFEEKPAFELVSADESGLNEAILITQKDIRQFQLASGAIRAGTELLLQKSGVKSNSIDRFCVAGGFGSFIDPLAARQIGLLPPQIPYERFEFCGNTSLAGAKLSLFDAATQEKARQLASQNHSVELASLPEFAAIFAESMIFPKSNLD